VSTSVAAPPAALPLAQTGFRVAATDLSIPMPDAARARTPVRRRR
jgi:hypothetical protein